MRVGQRVVRGLRLRERDHVADRLLAGEHGRETIEPERDPTHRRRAELERVEQEAELRARLVLGDAVALLQLAGELLAIAFDQIEVVVGQVSPLLLHLAFELLPVALDAIPVHLRLLSYAT